MKNIYIPEISNININSIQKYLFSENTEKIFLCFDGKYKYIDDKLYKFKINTFSNTDHLEKLDNINMYCSQIHISKLKEMI